MADSADLSVGAKALEFKLPASNGMQVSLSDYFTKSNVYLFFVREFN